MSGCVMLEVKNGTPYALTWVHLQREGETATGQEVNLLGRTVPPNGAILLGDVAPGTVRPVFGLHVEGGSRHGDHCVGPRLELEAGDGRTVGILFDRETGFSIGHRDARLYKARPDGTMKPTGAYTWSGRPTPPRR